MEIPEFHLRYDRETKGRGGSEHYSGITRQSTGTAKNEVNCMNDSKDFHDAESVRSGNSHFTSRPVSFPPHPIPGGMLSRSIGIFPKHPIPEGMLRPSFVSPSRRERPPSIWTHMVYRETFLQIHMHLHQLLILKNCINGIRPKSRSIHPQWRKVKGQNKIKI